MSCPSALDLLRYASGDQDAVDPTTASHVSACVDCTREVAALRTAAAVFRGADGASAPRTPLCPPDDQIAALAERALGAKERDALLPHVGSCSRCRGLLASLSRARRSLEGSEELDVLGHPGDVVKRGVRWRSIMIPVAAAAVLLLVIWSRGERPPLREPPATHQAPRPIRPVGQVAAPTSLVWSSIPQAGRYRVTIFDREGGVVWETQTADTSVSLPDTVHLGYGVEYYWKVSARIELNRWADSPLTGFTTLRE
jgi:hypothetical protein